MLILRDTAWPLKICALALFLVGCGEEAAIEDKELQFYKFFNPFYQIPESAMDQTCLIDVRTTGLSESRYNRSLDRIADDTGNGIVYSNPVTRDWIVYAAPVNCDELHKKSKFFPTHYFDQIVGFKKTNANEHPYTAKPSEFVGKKFAADLKEAAVAVDFDFELRASEEIVKRQMSDLLCISNANLRSQSRFGLPLTHIFAQGLSMIYVYNSYSVDTDLIHYLVESGLRECNANYNYEIRPLKNAELNYLSGIVESLSE